MNGTRGQWAAKVGALLMGAGMIIGPALTAAETDAAKSSDEKKLVLEKKSDVSNDEFNNWIDLSVGGAFVNGDPQAFRRRLQVPRGAFGGVEDFHMEQNVGTNSLLKIDGRAIFDNHDYLFKVELADPKVGYLRAGYREFRTWYDGSGGYSPRSNVWLRLTPYPDEMAIDRGEAWFEGGLTLKDWPELHFKYSHLFRDGTKDSLIWGDYNLNAGFPGGAVARGLVPSFRTIDEVRDIFQGDIKHTFGQTDVGLGLRYDIISSDNSLNIRRRPGEVPPLVSPPGLDRYVTQKDGFDEDMFNVHAFSETRFSEKVLFTVGYSFTTLDTDTSGSRIYGSGYDPVY
ncbi:MAG TPA: hypothetical protein VFA77_00195, partial [Candidatus Eisenbacteria bacterium]|nr:hypothetical protein [Candidatus Eisenbacteria bacterium]